MLGPSTGAQSDARLRGETGPNPKLLEVQLATVRFAVPYIEKLEDAVSFELEGAQDHPKDAPWPRPVVANPMGIWVDEHLPHLEEAVGFTAVEAQAIGAKPHGATAAGRTAPAPQGIGPVGEPPRSPVR